MTTPRRLSGAPIVGILLAAGSASRFGGAKLLATLPDGTMLGVAALRNLLAAVDSVVAVVRPGDDTLASALKAGGARVTVCPNAGDGMGASLAWGVRGAPLAAGWLIALADMPWIQPATIKRVADAVSGGAAMVAPQHTGARGHPVGIAARFYAELAALSADEGARRLVTAHTASLQLIVVDDAGVLRDIDTLADLVP
ncbi:MAG: nucleotidyltransferase family protein [Casimicrobiaceae bacterium]